MLFYLDVTGLEPAAREQELSHVRWKASRRPRGRVWAGLESDIQGLHALGEPLAAHQFVLIACSERFAAELQRWQNELPGEAQATLGNGLNAAAAPVAASRPVLRVPLGSPAELPAALAALRFAYTGCVEAGSVTEALEVRRQAAYLRIEGCGAACMEAIRGLLGAAATAAAVAAIGERQQPARQGSGGDSAAGNARSSGSDGAGAGANALGPVPPPLLEFFRASALWPEEAEEPAFSGVLAFAKQRLVAHFQDAVLVINASYPLVELNSLPAVGLEALLESDQFGTDDEASVLLVLAMWMEDNIGGTDAETRRRLCRQVRLVQMNRPYLTAILPVLAADYEAGPLPMEEGKEEAHAEEPSATGASAKQSPAEEAVLTRHAALPAAEESHTTEGVQPTTEKPAQRAAWFPIRVAEAAFVAALASTASPDEREALEEAAEGLYDLGSPWYCKRPRRQCLPEGGRAYKWTVPQPALEKAVGELQPGEGLWLSKMDGSTFEPYYANGFVWDPDMVTESKDSGKLSTQLRLSCMLPVVYDADASAVGSTRPIATANPPTTVRLAVHYREGLVQKEEALHVDSQQRMPVGTNQEWFKELTHQRPPARWRQARGPAARPMGRVPARRADLRRAQAAAA